ECFGGLSPELLLAPATRSEADPDLWWTPKDHFSHLLRVELYFNKVITAFLDGSSNPTDARGATREEAMAMVHRVNDDWMLEHRDVPYDELVRRLQDARAQTFALMARVDDDQFDVQMPNVPWSGGTISGVLTHNGGNHFERHWRWVTEGLAATTGVDISR
ncbi:MAG TPA: hypothetical protein VFZ17_14985, partial [Acidimicrobiia bacterium]|nr:hypothetical protein [Acidimicrobiia bacterium]